MFKINIDSVCLKLILILCATLVFVMFSIQDNYFNDIDSALTAEALIYVLTTVSILIMVLLYVIFVAICTDSHDLYKKYFKIGTALLIIVVTILFIIALTVFSDSPMTNGEFKEIKQQLVNTLENTECDKKLILIDTYTNILIGDYEYSNQFLVIDDRKIFTQVESKKLYDSYTFTCLVESK